MPTKGRGQAREWRPLLTVSRACSRNDPISARGFAENLPHRSLMDNMGAMKQACQMCGGQSSELKRGRCAVCYTEWLHARPVGMGANCICCGERRVENLKSAELLGAFVPTCFNCAGRITRLSTMPHSRRSMCSLTTALEKTRIDTSYAYSSSLCECSCVIEHGLSFLSRGIPKMIAIGCSTS